MQSASPVRPAWIDRCIESVRTLASTSRSTHELLGDELLDLAPPALRGLPSRLPATDVARLVLLSDRLRAGWDEVVWVDADVLVWTPSLVDIAPPASGVAVCDEVWVTTGPGGGPRALGYVNNAVLSSSDLGAVERLLEITLERIAAGGVGERSLGPDLLTPLHRGEPFPTVRGVGVVSPLVLAELAEGTHAEATRLLADASPFPLGAANLCASMAGEGPAAAAVRTLLRSGLSRPADDRSVVRDVLGR